MFPITWERYSEEELQEIIQELFEKKGYQVYNLHKVDRPGEMGADLECTKKGESEKLLIAVKKRPSAQDVDQLKIFSKRQGTKVYIYFKPPTSQFNLEKNKLQDNVSFWDGKKFSSELFHSFPKLFAVIACYEIYQKDFLEITLPFCKLFIDLDKKKRKPLVPAKADLAMINLLWNAKDRSTSLNKSLSSLQIFFEGVDFSRIDERTKESIFDAFFSTLYKLDRRSLRPLKAAFDKFIAQYPGNFDAFCIQTADRSNWIFFLQCLPELAPGFLVNSFEKGRKEALEMQEFFDKLKKNNSKCESEPNVGEILGNLASALSEGGYWLEDTIDNLLSIGLMGDWRAMREKFPEKNDFELEYEG